MPQVRVADLALAMAADLGSALVAAGVLVLAEVLVQASDVAGVLVLSGVLALEQAVWVVSVYYVYLLFYP